MATGPNVERAKIEVLAYCAQNGDVGCSIVHTYCSLAEFERFF